MKIAVIENGVKFICEGEFNSMMIRKITENEVSELGSQLHASSSTTVRWEVPLPRKTRAARRRQAEEAVHVVLGYDPEKPLPEWIQEVLP